MTAQPSKSSRRRRTWKWPPSGVVGLQWSVDIELDQCAVGLPGVCGRELAFGFTPLDGSDHLCVVRKSEIRFRDQLTGREAMQDIVPSGSIGQDPFVFPVRPLEAQFHGGYVPTAVRWFGGEEPLHVIETEMIAVISTRRLNLVPDGQDLLTQ